MEVAGGAAPDVEEDEDGDEDYDRLCYLMAFLFQEKCFKKDVGTGGNASPGGHASPSPWLLCLHARR